MSSLSESQTSKKRSRHCLKLALSMFAKRWALENEICSWNSFAKTLCSSGDKEAFEQLMETLEKLKKILES